MDNQNSQLTELMAEITKLKSDVDNLSQSFYKNNFSSSQTFTKDVVFQTRLQVPHYSSAPSVGVVGDLIEVSGTLYICTTAGSVSSPAVFTVVGTQT
jgi:hypothetical protein